MKTTRPGNVIEPVAHISKRELFARYEDTTNSVIREYVRIKSLSPLVAQELNPEPVTRSKKLTFDLIALAVDTERATEKVLKGRLDLQAAWFCMALGQPVKPELRKEIIWRCGRIYTARGLAKWAYWQRSAR